MPSELQARENVYNVLTGLASPDKLYVPAINALMAHSPIPIHAIVAVPGATAPSFHESITDEAPEDWGKTFVTNGVKLEIPADYGAWQTLLETLTPNVEEQTYHILHHLVSAVAVFSGKTIPEVDKLLGALDNFLGEPDQYGATRLLKSLISA